MSTIYTNHPDVKAIAQKAFPNYKGRKFSVSVVNHPVDVRSSWEGGSRTYFSFVNLNTKECFGVVPAQSAFDKPIQNADAVQLVSGLACVAHHIFCGKDCGIEIMIHPDNAPQLLTNQTVELTADEKTVLNYTGYKSSYAGISNYRFVLAHRQTGISIDNWETAKASLIVKGLLNKAGAITIEGKNAKNNP
ncbi:MAG: hypothetical protein RLY43_2152 [Bacteroidota bacterium]|jgi:hypothetical protein